jgi:predicted O-methyltransferase YrrM
MDNFTTNLGLLYADVPFTDVPTTPYSFYYDHDNVYFRHTDAIVLYSLLRHFKPRRVVEVGSGFSSRAMLDTAQLFLNDTIDFTFIEPYPERLLSLLRREEKERYTILQKPVQNVPIELFKSLESPDILFIDSSHIVKIGSDVGYIIFHILPVLNKGVIVHFHDIFWPFEYPKEWLMKGLAWNEAYFLRAFLQYNQNFQILLFNSFIGTFYFMRLGKTMPICLKNTGASLWIVKVN